MKQNIEAIIYARVSSKEQEKEGYSIDAQTRLLRDYARKEGFAILHEYVDVETEKKSGRKEFNQMLAFLKKHKHIQTILVEKTDRLYRNISDWVTLDALNLDIHFVKEGVVINQDSKSSEKFMHGIKVLMAKNYVDNLSEETKKGMTEKAAQGMWPSCAPLGYINHVAENGKKVIVPDPQMAGFIQKAFEWYATGNYAAKEITVMLRDAGFRHNKSGNALPTSTIHKMLRNRVYTGSFEWKGIIYQGAYEPIISQELWDAVQDVLDNRGATRAKKRDHNFAFSGLIDCAVTGGKLVGEIKKGKYIYYRAVGAKGLPYVREAEIEEQFMQAIKSLSFDDEVMAWIVQALKESNKDKEKFHEESMDRLHKEHKRLEQRLNAMYVDKLDGNISLDFYEQKATEWRNEQKRIEKNIEQLGTASQNYMNEGIQLLELVQNAHKLFAKQSAHEKRRLLNFMLSNSIWENGKLHITWKQPFDMIAEYSDEMNQGNMAKNDNLPISEKWLPILYQMRKECHEEVLDLATHVQVIRRNFGLAA